MTLWLTLTGDDGRPLLRYHREVRDGRPLADHAEQVEANHAEQAEANHAEQAEANHAEQAEANRAVVPAILAQMPGWLLATGDDALAEALVASGARTKRHSHCMSRDLVADPPPATWAQEALAPGLSVEAVDPSRTSELTALWMRAAPPGHVDHDPRSEAELLVNEVAPLVAGTTLGPLLPVSGMVVRAGQVVAVCLVNGRDGEPPLGGPWVGDVFRDPDRAYAGLGGFLLRRALTLGAASGLPGVGLAVTEGNPARGLYRRLGFRHVLTSRTLVLP